MAENIVNLDDIEETTDTADIVCVYPNDGENLKIKAVTVRLMDYKTIQVVYI